MGTTTININVQSGVVQQPPKANVNRDNQTILFIVNNPQGSGITFQNPPVAFPSPPPAGYAPWPGGAITAGSGPNQWTTNVNKQMPVGQNETYKYDILWVGGSLDPDVENEGYPGGEDEKGGSTKPGKIG